MAAMKITEALVAEHTIFLAAFDQIDLVLPSLATPMEIRTMAGIIQGMLESHATREAQLAYLALDHVLAEKGQLQRMHQDHEEIDERLERIQQVASCAEGRRLLKASLIAIREHFRLEERSIFPLLEKTLSEASLHELGVAWLDRTAVAPA
jgi:hemerythrin-like domain-containing protein